MEELVMAGERSNLSGALEVEYRQLFKACVQAMRSAFKFLKNLKSEQRAEYDQIQRDLAELTKRRNQRPKEMERLEDALKELAALEHDIESLAMLRRKFNRLVVAVIDNRR